MSYDLENMLDVLKTYPEKKKKTISCEEVQNKLPQNMSLSYVDYLG